MCRFSSVCLAMFTVVAVLITTTSNAAMVTNGLVAWYSFNGDTQDQSGHGNHATNYGATLTSDRFGNAGSAYQFSGGDYVQTPVAVGSSEGTLAAWVYVDSYQTGSNQFNLIFGQWDNLQLGLGDSNLVADGHWVFRRRDSGSVNDGNLDPVIGPEAVLGQWIHVAGVWTDSSMNLFLNGTAVGPALSVDSISPAGGNMAIGRHSHLYGQNYWFGRIDEVAIYNRALTPDELQQLAAVPLPPAVWLFGSALLGIFGIGYRHRL